MSRDSPGQGQPARGIGPAIQPGWRAASTHDTVARATIRQARRAGGALGRRAAWCAAKRRTRERGLRHGSLEPATRPALATTWPSQGPRQGRAKGHDKAGPRATTRPVCAPGCAQLGLVGVFCAL